MALVAFDGTPEARAWHNRWLSGEHAWRRDLSKAYHLRPYQNDCVEANLAAWDSGVRVTQNVLATGLGKTVTFADIARRMGDLFKRKTLTIVHREVLLQQTVQKLKEHTGDPSIGIERARERSFGEQHVVCTMQTAAKRLSRVGARKEFGCIIIDESHHADTDPRYRMITDYFSEAKVACFTATPKFSECLLVPERLVYYMDIKKGTREGWLVPLIGDRVEVAELFVRGVDGTSDEFDEGEIPEHLVNRAAPVRDVIMDRYGGRRGILFTDSVAEAFILNEALNSQRRGTSVLISSKTGKEQRKAALAALASGRARFFCNVGIATEGFDWPAADLVVVGGERSWHTYVQKVGRCTRPHPGTVDGLSSAEERRRAIAFSAKPNGIVVEMLRAGGTPQELVTQGTRLEDAYKEGVAQLVQRMELTCNVKEEESESELPDRPTLQQRDRPVISIDSETIYNVAHFGVEKRLTETVLERAGDGVGREVMPTPDYDEISSTPARTFRLSKPVEGWDKVPPTARQARMLEGSGLWVPVEATKQWAAWCLDIVGASPKWEMTDDKWTAVRALQFDSHEPVPELP